MTPGEEHFAFYHELGLAIAQWANVENALRYAVTACFDTEEDHRAVSVGFFSIESFRSKLEFADNLIQRKFAGSAHLPDWVKLVDRVRRASYQRNKLAHRLVKNYPQNGAGRRIVLAPWIFAKKKRKTKTPSLRTDPWD